MTPNQKRPEMTNLLLAVVLSTIILVAWQVFFEAPRQKVVKENMQREAALKEEREAALTAFKDAQGKPDLRKQRASIVAESGPRVKIASKTLHGSIALRGLRFDDLTLALYREKLEKDSPEVVLLSPPGYLDVYFAQIGWVSTDSSLLLPTNDTLWRADKDTLEPGAPVTLSWDNGRGLIFEVNIALDAHYLFTVEQRVINNSGSEISLQPYGFINRFYPKDHAYNYILHEGPIGVFGGQLTETSYGTLAEEPGQEQNFSNPA
jgi:YidC/Oxa1 family membrane protein insertase